MKTFIIMIGIILMYAAFSTFFRDTSLTGNIGKLIGDTNVALFGYVAYINIFLLFYPLYTLYRSPQKRREIDFYLGWILVFIALTIGEALVVEPAKAGFLGRETVAFLAPYIGKAGLWLFWLMIVALAAVFLVDENFNWRAVLPQRPFASVLEEDTPKKRRFSFAFVTRAFSALKRGLKNPFASPRFEEELMPEIDPVQIKREEKRTALRTTDRDKVTSKRKKVSKIEAKHTETAEPAHVPEKSEPHFEADEEASQTADTVSAPSQTPPVSKVVETSESIAEEKGERVSKSGIKIVNELEENSKLLNALEKGHTEKPKNFKLPKLDFLQKPPKRKKRVNEAEIDRKSGSLLEKLKLFNIQGDIVRTYSGPLVTTFEFKPAPNVKVSKILGLQDDLAMALSAETIRIQAPIPGRDVVGIEIPNEERDIIYLREILESELFQNSASPLTIALGKDIVGKPFVTDIKKLPHLLIAGTTGSGKSVGINAMILSLLYKNDPDKLKLMMIDPKMLEFSIYDDIPHLITPVITEPKKAIAALANMVAEMERRYKLMAEKRTKNIDNYNAKVKKEGSAEPMPYIVVIIDELADLMMNGGKEVETSIARLAQKSRACGIHLIVATQRPSVDVVTGIIKANLPSRLSYRVGQKIDSKVILDSLGAESLLGRGDGLFTPPGTTGLVRIHAPWATEEEIEHIVEYLKAQRAPEYDESYLIEGGGVSGKGADNEAGIELDPLYEEAKEIVLTDKKTSISYLQRKLQIGYNRSANIIEQLEKTGVLSAPNAKGNREILV